MTTPEELVKQGLLEDAIASLQQRVRSAPSKAADRVFLFQLFALTGQWERARTQLAVAGELDSQLLLTVAFYTPAIECEVLRASVFRGEREPMVLGQPEEWLAKLLQANRLSGQGHHVAAAELRSEALDAAPASRGLVNDQPFEWIADADPRFGPCLEIVLQGKYYWVPWSSVRSLKIPAPQNLHDFVWAPAEVEWYHGGQVSLLVPARYPGTEAAENVLRLGRETRWTEVAEGVVHGCGQRLLATDAADHALLEVRSVDIEPVEPVEPVDAVA